MSICISLVRAQNWNLLLSLQQHDRTRDLQGLNADTMIPECILTCLKKICPT